MTDEKTEQLLWKLIEDTKSNKIKWDYYLSNPNTFICNLGTIHNEFFVAIQNPYINSYTLSFKSNENEMETFRYEPGSTISVLITRLWNLLESKASSSNRIDSFIDSYLFGDTNR